MIPEFLINMLINQYGNEQTNKIIEGYKTKRINSLRINTSLTTKEEIISILKKENIKIGTTNPIELCETLTNLIRTNKEIGEVYVATDGNFMGYILNFTANKEGVKEIYYCFNNQIIQLPQLNLKLSKTKQKILKSLEENEQTAILISKKVGISRAMTYKHLNDLMEEGLVKQTKRYEKYYLTNAGRIAII